MEIVYARGSASATDVLAALPDPPTRTSVRTLLRILEDKGHLTHTVHGREFVYKPTRPRARVGRSAFRHVLRAFFGDSLEKAVAAHLADPDTTLSAEQANALKELIDRARERGR
jgi:predicted transcriptional regulator